MSVHFPETFEELKQIINENDTVVVKFGADWCMPCKAMAPILDNISKEYDSIKFLSVDIDSEGMEEILKVHNILSLPTTMKFVKGEVTSTGVGALNKHQLVDLLSNEG
jgi:thioredoxin 1